MATATAATTSTRSVARSRRATTEPAVPTPRARRRTRTHPATLSPGYRAGTWRVEGELGRGGMASVYAVVHAKFGKRAALKLAHRSILGPEFTADTFLREARVVNLVAHPSVPDVFATGTFDGRPYLVMERLSGETLGTRLGRGPIPKLEAIEIMLELCDVLATAHAAGVVHRDLKLDNILLLASPCAGGPRVKLVDWGVARIIGEDDPLVGMIAGTLTYVAPEQIRGDDITPACDLYSLGVLAYQMLFGQPPFASVSDLELIHKHLRAEPPPPRSLWANIPTELERVLVAMLAKRAEARPSLDTVIAVLRSMRTVLAPAAPKRPSWLAALPRTPPVDVFGRPAVQLPATRHHRLLGATLAIALVLASLGSMWS
jgi:serine/threonine protein kinase